jgi:hypothetical protein
VTYNLPAGWYLSSVPIITANWEASSGNTWTVPMGGGVGKLFRLGKLLVNTQLQPHMDSTTESIARAIACTEPHADDRGMRRKMSHSSGILTQHCR